ncbi:hypothetical protein TcasGA2_TC002809 [Tribolium castaneum]|uniref:Uncharacterized protein n=1 Tax=Tribolium castaneum TaxID=7070 RepID=D6WIC4_TRICA|nr:hypothetical protein TcasGA2_TC002809 [Tribolium castaneum]
MHLLHTYFNNNTHTVRYEAIIFAQTIKFQKEAENRRRRRRKIIIPASIRRFSTRQHHQAMRLEIVWKLPSRYNVEISHKHIITATITANLDLKMIIKSWKSGS